MLAFFDLLSQGKLDLSVDTSGLSAKALDYTDFGTRQASASLLLLALSLSAPFSARLLTPLSLPARRRRRHRVRRQHRPQGSVREGRPPPPRHAPPARHHRRRAHPRRDPRPPPRLGRARAHRRDVRRRRRARRLAARLPRARRRGPSGAHRHRRQPARRNRAPHNARRAAARVLGGQVVAAARARAVRRAVGAAARERRRRRSCARGGAGRWPVVPADVLERRRGAGQRRVLGEGVRVDQGRAVEAVRVDLRASLTLLALPLLCSVQPG